MSTKLRVSRREAQDLVRLPREGVEQRVHAAPQAGRGPAAFDVARALREDLVDVLFVQIGHQRVPLLEHDAVGVLEALHVLQIHRAVLLQPRQHGLRELAVLAGQLGQLLQLGLSGGELRHHALQRLPSTMLPISLTTAARRISCLAGTISLASRSSSSRMPLRSNML